MLRKLKEYKKFIVVGFLTVLLFLLYACTKEKEQYQGYIETRLAFISASYPGVLQQVFVKRGDSIKVAQPLFTLEAQPQNAAYLQAQADLDAALAEQRSATENVNYLKTLLSRQQFLVDKKALDQQSLDATDIQYKDALAKQKASDARVNATKANLDQAQWAKSQKAIVAEQDGVVFDTYFLPTEFVGPGRPVLSLIYPNMTQAIFFVPEIKLSQLKVGQKIKVTCDGQSKAEIAQITFISPKGELTPPILYNDKDRAKFVYRIEASPGTDRACFHPGQPVTIIL